MDKLQEKIASRAYELFQARGGQHGYHIADWLQAEKEISGDTPAAAPKAAAVKAPVKATTAEESVAAKAKTAPVAKKKTAAKSK